MEMGTNLVPLEDATKRGDTINIEFKSGMKGKIRKRVKRKRRQRLEKESYEESRAPVQTADRNHSDRYVSPTLHFVDNTCT